MKEAQPMAGFVIVPQDVKTCEQVYFDGVSGLLVGTANSKIAFHQIVAGDDTSNREQRKIVLTVVMPTTSLVEFCVNYLQGIEQNKKALENSINEQRDKMFGATAKLQSD